jgi:hypoxanthine phosphoribosyltransferase
MTATSSPQIYVDITPEKIQAQETYIYEVEISANPDTRLIDQKSEITVEVPYDGYQYLRRDAVRRLKDEIVSFTSTNDGHAGWLALSHPLDWESDWSRNIGVEKSPLRIPLKHEKLIGEKLWTSDEYRAILHQSYKTDDLRFWPVAIDLRILDDITDSAQSLDQYLELIEEFGNGEGQLSLNLEISTLLPAVLAREDVYVIVKRIQIHWPTIPPPDQIALYLMEQNSRGRFTAEKKKWRYNPDEKSIEIKGIPTKKLNRQADSPLIPFRCLLSFVMMSPSEAITQSVLSGEVEINIENLLISGREVALMNVNGYRRDIESFPKLGQRSVIVAKTKAYLGDQLSKRRTATYRHWVFPGVDLSEIRASDLAAALRDLGYRTKHKNLEKGKTEPSPESENIVNAPNDGELIVHVKGHKLGALPNGDYVQLTIDASLKSTNLDPTRREREIPDGTLVSTEFHTRNLIINIFAWMEGPGSLLDLDLEDLMLLLQDRFSVVAELR